MKDQIKQDPQELQLQTFEEAIDFLNTWANQDHFAIRHLPKPQAKEKPVLH